MKICFEGPSGIGKTTLSQLLSKEYKIIPEVNKLFKEEKNEGGLWYYKKQVERYQLSEISNNTIFDGDIFQPLWYNWSYNFPKGYLSIDEMKAFYEVEINNKNIQFPDLYIIFQTSVENLRKRKAKDKTRRRRYFEKHLQLLKTQPLYFGFLKKEFPYLVEFVTFDSLLQAEAQVRKIIISRKNKVAHNSLQILNVITDWLHVNKIDYKDSFDN